MSTAVTLFNNDKAIAVPDHIRNRGNVTPDVIATESIPAITFRGSKWRLRKGDEEVLITKTVDGEQIPIPSISVVVVGTNPKRSRYYFEGAFVEGENKSPTCWSTFGDEPDADVVNKQAATCASCKWSVKGSKITEAGKEVTACQGAKRLAVVPVGLLASAESAFILKVPQTSLWDKDNKEAEAAQKFAWDQYMKFLMNRGVQELRTLVTKISFDPNTAYPKLLFQAARWTTAEELAKADELFASDSVQSIIGLKQMPSVSKSAPQEEPANVESTEEEIAESSKKQPPVSSKAAPAKSVTVAKQPEPEVDPDEDDDEADEDTSNIMKDAGSILDELEDDEEDTPVPESKPAPKRNAKKPSKPAPKKAQEDEPQMAFDLDDDASEEKPKAASAKQGSGIESIATGWGD